MAKIKNFSEKAHKNRIRVQRCRRLQKIKLDHENHVRKLVDGQLNTVDCEENECTEIEPDFDSKLKCWAINHRISASAISDLLRILIIAGFNNLPKDSRTFMRTPTNVAIKNMSNGQMWYNGVENCLWNIFSNIKRDISITLDFNFDGIPIFKSSNLQFWPILMAIQGNFKSKKHAFDSSTILFQYKIHRTTGN